jgi:hypothetical protein
MTMLDKAAAAAWPFLWDTTDTATPAHDAARKRMRAALQAIREPNKVMTDAGNASDYESSESLNMESLWIDPAIPYRAMIDAILSGGA